MRKLIVVDDILKFNPVQLRAWIWTLFNADENYRISVSLHQLQREWKTSLGSVRGLIKQFEAEGKITVTASPKGTEFAICEPGKWYFPEKKKRTARQLTDGSQPVEFVPNIPDNYANLQPEILQQEDEKQPEYIQQEDQQVSELISAPGEKKGRKTKSDIKPKVVTYFDQIIGRFEQAYEKERGMPYVITGAPYFHKQAAQGILAAFKQFEKDIPVAERKNSEEMLDEMSVFFTACLTVKDQWLRDNCTLTLIANKFNNYLTSITNHERNSIENRSRRIFDIINQMPDK